MGAAPALSDISHVAITRLKALVPLDQVALSALQAAMAKPRRVSARTELQVEGDITPRITLILSGWAARTRILKDGRRQIINFLLPGDLIFAQATDQLAAANITAITDLFICDGPSPALSSSLAAAYAASSSIEESLLYGQISRLGRLTAQERVADLLLELLERHEMAGIARAGKFAIPITQEMVADTVGLTPVHVNRVIQSARQAGMLTWKNGMVQIHGWDTLRRKFGHHRMRASSCHRGNRSPHSPDSRKGERLDPSTLSKRNAT
ncbi:Crp/Fnr family transcriptional regulator [Sphingobium yanoikuyae]|uniref:Cyclic nucleotide-binding protein n=1 Tax=Sphingobium yanoikuyae TaxID=13690 RepID=A0A291MXR6_SPHYA|nr:Crp/Fnr family transcriptional regulator [Sphingobium yanoikuyae]ATI79872.1 cyclic nucleotide-binding protein [Sphingobium yanoikuyae]